MDNMEFRIGIENVDGDQPGSSGAPQDKDTALAELQAIRQQLEATGRGPIAPASYEHRPQPIVPPVPPTPAPPPQVQSLSEGEWRQLLRQFGPALAKVIAEQGEVARQRLKPQSPQAPVSQDVQRIEKIILPAEAAAAPKIAQDLRGMAAAPAGGNALDAVARRLDQIAARLGTLIDQLRNQARPQTPLSSAPPPSATPAFTPPQSQQGVQPSSRQPPAPPGGPPPIPPTRQPPTPPGGGGPPVPPGPPSPPGGGGPPVPPFRNPPPPPGGGQPPFVLPAPKTPVPAGIGGTLKQIGPLVGGNTGSFLGNLGALATAAEAIPIAGAALAAAAAASRMLEGAFNNAARGVELFGRQLSAIAENDYGRALEDTFQGMIEGAREIPIVGGLYASAINAAISPIKAFTSVLDGFLDRARQLQQFNPELAMAGANAEVRSLLLDIHEANELGPHLAHLVDSQSRLSAELREIFLPLKGIAIDKIGEILDGISQTVSDVHKIAEKLGVSAETASNTFSTLASAAANMVPGGGIATAQGYQQQGLSAALHRCARPHRPVPGGADVLRVPVGPLPARQRAGVAAAARQSRRHRRTASERLLLLLPDVDRRQSGLCHLRRYVALPVHAAVAANAAVHGTREPGVRGAAE